MTVLCHLSCNVIFIIYLFRLKNRYYWQIFYISINFRSTPKHGDCLTRQKAVLGQIELKLDTGLDRSINAIVGWVKMYLQSEQRKTDFKPETDVDTLSTSACLAVVQYVTGMIRHIRDRLDGKNAENVLTELGIRFHRVIYEHLQQFQFNSAGAMCAICDMNEYRKCVKELNVGIVTSLFDTLHALCNLLLVKPANLKQVCTGDQLVNFIFKHQLFVSWIF